MNNCISETIKLLNNQQLYTLMNLSKEAIGFCHSNSNEEIFEHIVDLIEGPDIKPGEVHLLDYCFIYGTQIHQEFVAKMNTLSNVERKELLAFICECVRNDELKYELYDFIDKHIEKVDPLQLATIQMIEIKGNNFTRKEKISQTDEKEMAFSFCPDWLKLTEEEQTILLQAGRPSFNTVQRHQTISVSGFLRYLSQSVDREESVEFERGSEGHLSLIEKLNALIPEQMEQVFQAVMQSWYEHHGQLSEMNMLYSKDELKDIFNAFHKMHQIALIDAAQSCKNYVFVGVPVVMNSFKGALFSPDNTLGGILVSGSNEYFDLLNKFNTLDDIDQRILVLACTSFWFYTETQEQNFGWMFESEFPMSNAEYVRSQIG